MKTAIKNANIIQAQEAAFKDIVASYVLSVDPPGKVDQQFLKYFF